MSHYKPYPAYKDSGVEWIGLVPEHWKVAQIKRISALNPKKSTLSEEKDSLCTFLPMEKLRTNAITLDETRPIHEVYDGYSYFCDDDILIAKVTPCFENGNIAVANGLVNGIGFGSTEINVLRVNGKGHNRFLYYRLQEEQFRTIAKSEMRGTGGLKRVPTELFESFAIGLPDTDEQATIAATLDRETSRIDALIQKKTRFIELLKEKRQALITHAVTKGLDPNVKMKDSGVEWIGLVPEHWGVKRLRHVGRYSNSGVDKKSYEDQQTVELCNYTDVYYNEFINDDMPFMQATASSHEIEQFTLRKGDVIITKDSEDPSDIGIPAFVRHDMPGVVCGYHLTMIRALNDNYGSYIHRSLQSDHTKAHFFVESPGITRYGLNQNTIGNAPVALPPPDEQATIAATLDRETARIDALIGKAEHSITLLKERRSAFITAAVTGQIDLRGEQ